MFQLETIERYLFKKIVQITNKSKYLHLFADIILRGSSMSSIFVEPQQFFLDTVGEAIDQRKVEDIPLLKSYLADLLLHFIHADNLYNEESASGKKAQPTLAELYFKAMNAPGEERISLLKKLGDTSLYVSGVFGESLQRKLVDVDYYANMGGAAYMSLADSTEELSYRDLYQFISKKFIELMEVLTVISQKTLIQNNQNLLRLYETYIQTGSELAKEHLLEKGLIHLPPRGKKSYSQ